MADKYLYADGKLVGAVTKVEVSLEIPSVEPIKTFTGNVPADSVDEIPCKISVEKLRYDKISDFDDMEGLFLSMIKNPKNLSVVERTNGIDGKLIKSQFFYKCKMSNAKYTLDTENKTADNLEFTATNFGQWDSKGKKIIF